MCTRHVWYPHASYTHVRTLQAHKTAISFWDHAECRPTQYRKPTSATNLKPPIRRLLNSRLLIMCSSTGEVFIGRAGVLCTITFFTVHRVPTSLATHSSLCSFSPSERGEKTNLFLLYHNWEPTYNNYFASKQRSGFYDRFWDWLPPTGAQQPILT